LDWKGGGRRQGNILNFICLIQYLGRRGGKRRGSKTLLHPLFTPPNWGGGKLDYYQNLDKSNIVSNKIFGVQK
jgi:hypothetical protein